MMVLTRKADQAIVIGEDISITVLEIRGDRVRLGIDCPREKRVHRGEVRSGEQQEQPDAPRGEKRR